MKRTLITVLLATATQPLWAGSNYNLDNVYEAVTTNHFTSDYTAVYAHRGAWRTASENSLAAMDAAANANIEVVELDVLSSKPGTPWLYHDWTLEKQTTGKGTFSQQSDRYISSLSLKDRYGNVISPPESVPAFLDAMQHWGAWCRSQTTSSVNRGYLLVIDIKVADATSQTGAYQTLRNAWNLLNSLEDFEAAHGIHFPYTKYAIFKLRAKELPADPAVLRQDFPVRSDGRVITLLPIVYGDPGVEQSVYDQYHAQRQWAGAYFGTWEVYQKYPGQEPTTTDISQLKGLGFTAPGFPGWDDNPEGLTNKGICCAWLTTVPNPDFPNYSGSWEYWQQQNVGATFLGGDQFDTLIVYLQSLGLRNLAHIQ